MTGLLVLGALMAPLALCLLFAVVETASTLWDTVPTRADYPPGEYSPGEPESHHSENATALGTRHFGVGRRSPRLLTTTHVLHQPRRRRSEKADSSTALAQ